MSASLDLSNANALLSDDEASSGRIALEHCRLEQSTVDLRDVSRAPLLFWFVRSRFDGVDFPAERAADGWLNVRNGEFTGGTELPGSWVRTPHASSR